MDSSFITRSYRQGRRTPPRLQGVGIVDPVSAGIIADIAAPLIKFLGNLGVTNDNAVIAARDKIGRYVTQVLGGPFGPTPSAQAMAQLYTGFQLAHADINNVGTKSYYVGVLDRLNKACIKYILEHAQDSSAIFGEQIDPNFILNRYTQFVTEGKPLDHAFWLAFTGRKDPFDIRTGAAAPVAPSTTTTSPTTAEKIAQTYQVVRDSAGLVVQIKDAAGNILKPGTAEYNAAINQPQPVKAGTGLALAGVALLLGIGAWFAGRSPKPKNS